MPPVRVPQNPSFQLSPIIFLPLRVPRRPRYFPIVRRSPNLTHSCIVFSKPVIVRRRSKKPMRLPVLRSFALLFSVLLTPFLLAQEKADPEIGSLATSPTGSTGSATRASDSSSIGASTANSGSSSATPSSALRATTPTDSLPNCPSPSIPASSTLKTGPHSHTWPACAM